MAFVIMGGKILSVACPFPVKNVTGSISRFYQFCITIALREDRASQKRACKTAEDLTFFEASEDGYRERLEQIKLQKKNNHKKLKTVERCLERNGSTLDAELEYRIPIDYMVDLAEVEKDEVPRNSYQQTEDLVVSQAISKILLMKLRQMLEIEIRLI